MGRGGRHCLAFPHAPDKRRVGVGRGGERSEMGGEARSAMIIWAMMGKGRNL